MIRHSRRGFTTGLGALAAMSAVRTAAAGPMALAASPRTPTRCVSAAEVRVTPGLWNAFEDPVRNLHFESLFLQQPDGVRLHALVYFPLRASARKLPSTLRTDPYRGEPPDLDSPSELFEFARNGYVAVYLCVRGTGSSEGVPSDEYSVAENEDTARIIEWLSRQPWSNGRVGMYGTSYSAFNSVWVAAALKPRPLKALFVRAGTDNRYTDDVHYPGGTMVMVNNAWALGMLVENATPGAPAYDIDSAPSRDRWNTPPWLGIFLRNQLDGPHWQRGSLAPDYSRLTVPTFLAGGYLDKYQNFVPRIMRNSPATTRGILGPWHHSMIWPGPVLDWNSLMIRWFDHWLKDRDTGMLREPRVAFYLPEWQRQSFRYKSAVPGQWRYLNEWPQTVFAPAQRLYLRSESETSGARSLAADPMPGRGGLLSELAGGAAALQLLYRPGRGGTDQSFGPTNGNGYFGIDHRDEDSYGLCFDTEPLRSPVEILGFATARLYVSATAPVANWIARIHDVAPDGTSYLVTRGFLNGTHRYSHTHPEPLSPGEVYPITVELMCTGYRFASGHRIRVVITNADFPVIWPSPYPMTTTLFTGGDRASFISLPVLHTTSYLQGSLPIVADSIIGIQRPLERVRDGVRKYTMLRDYSTDEVVAAFDLGEDSIECRVNERDPATASLILAATRKAKSKNGDLIETRVEGKLSSTASTFDLDVTVTLLKNATPIRSKNWREVAPRQFV